MEPLYTLIFAIIGIGIFGYLITLGTFKLLETLILKTKGGLSGIFVFLVIVGCVFALLNKEKAPEYLEKIQFWKNNSSLVDVYDYQF